MKDGLFDYHILAFKKINPALWNKEYELALFYYPIFKLDLFIDWVICIGAESFCKNKGANYAFSSKWQKRMHFPFPATHEQK